MPSIASSLREMTPSLPRAQRRVAFTLLADYPVAGLRTVASLAEKAEVSAPTVLGLVERLGYTGFGAFQDDLRIELRKRLESPLDQYTSPPRDRAVTDRSREAFTRCISRTFDGLDPDELDRATELLAAPRRRVWTTGGRFSSLAARSLALHLEVLRPDVRYVGPDERRSLLIDLGRRDVVATFDLRRYQVGTVEFGRAAKRQGAGLVLVTDEWLSPLAQDADVVLIAALDAPSPFDSLVGTAVIVETLIGGVVERLGELPMSRMQAYDQAWGNGEVPRSGSIPRGTLAEGRP